MRKGRLSAFERSLIDSQEAVVGSSGLSPVEGAETGLEDLSERYRELLHAMAVRKQVDGFLVSAGRRDEIIALLLTIITTGHLFGYNRAFVMLYDPEDGSIRGHAGIGELSREETWSLWGRILEEKPGLEQLVARAMKDFQEHKSRLAPILERMVLPPGDTGPVAEALRGREARLLEPPMERLQDSWLMDLLQAGQVGVIPMWGYWGHFGVLLVDNFASSDRITLEGLQILSQFAKPFISALEKALIIERYAERVAELQEAKAHIEAQQEMLLRMERKNTMGRFTSILAHNLRNPLVSMSGHLNSLERGKETGQERAELLRSLQQDVRNLDRFIGDFISQVEEDHPRRHYWDLNHMVGEVVMAYRRFNVLSHAEIRVREEPIPLVSVDYEKVAGVMARLMGLIHLQQGHQGPIEISTRSDGSKVTVSFGGRNDLAPPSPHLAEELAEETDRLKDFLEKEGVTLSRDADNFILEFGC